MQLGAMQTKVWKQWFGSWCESGHTLLTKGKMRSRTEQKPTGLPLPAECFFPYLCTDIEGCRKDFFKQSSPPFFKKNAPHLCGSPWLTKPFSCKVWDQSLDRKSADEVKIFVQRLYYSALIAHLFSGFCSRSSPSIGTSSMCPNLPRISDTW